MLAKIKHTQFDPITNRQISDACWNGHHDDPEDDESGVCMIEDCKCLCHDKPTEEVVP